MIVEIPLIMVQCPIEVSVFEIPSKRKYLAELCKQRPSFYASIMSHSVGTFSPND